jgi:hypothetical protein
MDDQLDNDLRDHIKEVFENFEDPSADEGWLQLRKKFPEEQSNRRAFAWIWWGAAAILFLFLAIGIWMYSTNNQLKKYAVKTPKHAQPQNLAKIKSNKDTNGKNTPFHTESQAKGVAGNIASASNSSRFKIPAPLNKKIPVIARAPLILNDTTGKKTLIAKTTDTAMKAINQLQAQQIVKTEQTNNSIANSTTNPVIVKPKQPAKSITEMLVENQAVKNKKTEDNSERVRFGVYTATYFNYAKGSNNQANAGGGITADIKIAKNLKLVTGITIGQNSLNFTTGVPTNTAQNNLAVVSAPNMPAAPAASNVASAYSIKSAVTVASVPAFKNYDASLVGLDIPLNLKYEFNPKKYSFYVLAGLSSGTFINETYTYQYNYPALLSPSLQQTQEEISRKRFNGFYFAKTLNLAFGIGHPLGRNHIILEPFLKYPIDGLGSQNIRFGAGGVNLKFNLQPFKK